MVADAKRVDGYANLVDADTFLVDGDTKSIDDPARRCAIATSLVDAFRYKYKIGRD